ncbi:MAG: F0F1 ATP synthase subunit B [Albidovulum sp.]|jgi:F-type H+-transporting ATPase subunit b|uniref:F0F1 ATP synthase subunit B n=1 Tax=Albidovulum sp. TaxID=1872424 RepID=UPI001323AA39|nr:F0F1 ATP synthase subunit B [Defluviimonas sp.]KAB2885437.1 MAG: F0F1 ATP synthase subunit B [Defluviimonas sp.]
MNRILLSTLPVLVASPAFAAGGPFFSLRNTNFVVLLAFLIFVGVLVYFKVPALIGGLLDKRAAGIKSELDQARALHDEARSILASYERKQKEVQEQADRIVETAKREALAAAEQAKADLKAAIKRRLAAAEDQIASAEASAVREVRDRAVSVAVAAAGDLIAAKMSAAEKNKLIEASIGEVETRLH